MVHPVDNIKETTVVVSDVPLFSVLLEFIGKKQECIRIRFMPADAGLFVCSVNKP